MQKGSAVPGQQRWWTKPDQVSPRCLIENVHSSQQIYPEKSLKILNDGTISGISSHNSREIYKSFFQSTTRFFHFESVDDASWPKTKQKKKVANRFSLLQLFFLLLRLLLLLIGIVKQLKPFWWTILYCVSSVCVEMGLLCVFSIFITFFGHWRKENKRQKSNEGEEQNGRSWNWMNKTARDTEWKRQCKKAVETCFALFSIAKNGISQKGVETTEAKTDKKNLFV